MQKMEASDCNVQELRLRKKGKTQDEADEIGKLPDDIICHMFSFLSTVDVVQTSILMKRWRNLWTSVPTLDFDDDRFPMADGENKFARFVNKVLNCYTAQHIQRYHLSIKQLHNSKFVDTWVNFAVEHNVQELHLELPHGSPFEMPFCRSVRVLQLHGDLRLPASGCFSSLEILSLTGVQLTNDDGTLNISSQQYPLLRSCSLISCMALISLNISCSLLEHLDIQGCFDLDQLRVFAENLRFMNVLSSFAYGDKTSLLELAAPSLQTFEWLDYIMDDFSIGNFTCLESAHVSLVFHYHPERKESYVKNARKFLHHLACAENLHMEMPCFWDLPANKELLEGLSTRLCNLKHLTLFAGLDDGVFRGISCLLESCSNLEILHVRTIEEHLQKELYALFPDISHFTLGETSDYQRKTLDHLLEASICGFRGEEHEIQFVQFLMACAPTLKKMVVSFSGQASADLNVKVKLAEKLLAFKKASRDLIFSCG